MTLGIFALSSRRQRLTGQLRAPLLRLVLLLGIGVLGAVPAHVRAASGELDAAQEAIAGGRFQTAIDILEPLIRQQPDNSEARFLRGVVYAQMGDTDRAIAIFSNLTENYPDLSEPHNNLAVLYAAKGSLEKAREALLRATELQPDYHTAFENLGDVYTKLAAQAYQRAYRLPGKNQRARDKYDVVSGLLARPEAGTEGPADSLAPVPVAGDVEAAPPQAAPQAPAAAAGGGTPCLALGPMDANTRGNIAVWLEEQDIAHQTHSRESRRPRAYQVYLEGGANPRALRDRLSGQGVKDIALVTSGELAGQLSLGVYRQADSVERRLERFADLGYDARVLTLYDETVEHWLVITQQAFDAPAFKRIFGHQTPQPVACDWQPRERS
ncbi:MAG: tetratricopeptide repeat protein [Gammaproteobacteria bacterium]|nr:tetratricopeptide repeat protein [Gammaproteobacteria bacterium]